MVSKISPSLPLLLEKKCALHQKHSPVLKKILQTEEVLEKLFSQENNLNFLKDF